MGSGTCEFLNSTAAGPGSAKSSLKILYYLNRLTFLLQALWCTFLLPVDDNIPNANEPGSTVFTHIFSNFGTYLMDINATR